MARAEILSVILLSVVLIGGVTAQPPPGTQCTSSDTSACQEPFYADDQDEYLYDQDASWVLEGGTPSDSGPSTFFGALSYDTGTEEIDSSSSGQLQEQFIDSPGSAEGGSQNSFGRGDQIQQTISAITDQDVKTNGDGESYVVTPPNEGMCGDGIKQGGEDPGNCPEDAGLPNKTISGESPSSSGYFSEEGSVSKDFGHEESGETLKIDGTIYENEFPDYYTDGDYIIEVQDTQGVSELVSGTHLYKTDYNAIDATKSDEPDDPDPTVYSGGDNATDYDPDYCTDVTKEENVYVSGTVEFDPGEANPSQPADYYDNPYTGVTTQGEVSADITYNSDVSGDPVYTCSNSQGIYTSCECDPNTDDNCDCNEANVEKYSTSSFNAKAVVESDWAVDYDNYGISENPFHWGPVNNELDFSGYGNVINGNGGYFAYGSPEDSREASNDPSVSKTSYAIKDKSTYFEAVRTSTTVANADGQNGRSNGIVAYNEDSNSISGSTEGFLSNELADYNIRDYLDASDVKSKISCPEDRCLASVDITTEDSGWSHYGLPSFSPDIYSVSVDSTVSVTDSAGACETYSNLSGLSDEELDCSPGPNFDVCGEYTWEQKVYKEGDDVDETVLSNHKAHEEACMDTRNQESYCVLGNSTKGTELVKEGTVANIAPFHHDNNTYHTNDYQAGGNSPDRSVCLNRDSSTIQGEWLPRFAAS